MILNIRPGNLNEEYEFDELINTVNSRKAADFHIDLEQTTKINLSKFNALIKLYVNMRREGRNLCYSNMQVSIRHLVDKTNFHHVFKKKNT